MFIKNLVLSIILALASVLEFKELGKLQVVPDKKNINQKHQPLTVTYCDLVTHPELYEDKIVRVDATYVLGKHSVMLTDKTCAKRKEQGGISFVVDCSSESSCKKMNSIIRKDRTGNAYWSRVQMIVVGRFNGPPKSGGTYNAQIGQESGFKFQIKVSKIEKTSRIPIDEPLD